MVSNKSSIPFAVPDSEPDEVIITTKSRRHGTITTSHMVYLDEGDILSTQHPRNRFLATMRRIGTRLQRQTSFDSGSDLHNYPVRRPRSSHHLHRSRYNTKRLPALSSTECYLDKNFTTKSELAIEMPSTSDRFDMAARRKDSNSTMSAIQLSASNSGPSTSSQRHHSSTSGTQNIHMQRQLQSTVRRIKSSALDQPSAQPSYSNLTAHPNSVETINGRMLRNPPHAIIPPPSSLVS